MLETYRPSGRIGAGLIPMAVAYLLLFTAAAWLYQALLDWIPLIYLNLLATLGFALVGGIGMGMVAHTGRCRNNTLAVLLAILLTIPAILASHWFGYKRTMSDFAADPDPAIQAFASIDFPKYIEFRVDTGWSFGRIGRSQGGASITGPFVWGFWTLEAVIILGGALLGARSATSTPYCEACDAWTEGPHGVMVRDDLDDEAIRQLQQAATADEVLSLAPSAAPGEFVLTYAIHKCRQCEESTFLTVSRVVEKTNKKGKTERDTTELLINVRLSQHDVATLKKRLETQATTLATMQASEAPTAEPPDADEQETAL